MSIMASSKRSYIKSLRDWEELLAAVGEHAESMPEVADLRAALEQHMARARALKARQDSAKATRQGLTQELSGELDKGRDVAMRIRGIAKARIGPKNEQITQFGVAPLRRRTRRAKSPEPVPPPTLPPEAAQPKGGDVSRL
jgi:hypothetical protein